MNEKGSPSAVVAAAAARKELRRQKKTEEPASVGFPSPERAPPSSTERAPPSSPERAPSSSIPKATKKKKKKVSGTLLRPPADLSGAHAEALLRSSSALLPTATAEPAAERRDWAQAVQPRHTREAAFLGGGRLQRPVQCTATAVLRCLLPQSPSATREKEARLHAAAFRHDAYGAVRRLFPLLDAAEFSEALHKAERSGASLLSEWRMRPSRDASLGPSIAALEAPATYASRLFVRVEHVQGAVEEPTVVRVALGGEVGSTRPQTGPNPTWHSAVFEFRLPMPVERAGDRRLTLSVGRAHSIELPLSLFPASEFLRTQYALNSSSLNSSSSENPTLNGGPKLTVSILYENVTPSNIEEGVDMEDLKQYVTQAQEENFRVLAFYVFERRLEQPGGGHEEELAWLLREVAARYRVDASTAALHTLDVASSSLARDATRLHLRVIVEHLMEHQAAQAEAALAPATESMARLRQTVFRRLRRGLEELVSSGDDLLEGAGDETVGQLVTAYAFVVGAHDAGAVARELRTHVAAYAAATYARLRRAADASATSPFRRLTVVCGFVPPVVAQCVERLERGFPSGVAVGATLERELYARLSSDVRALLAGVGAPMDAAALDLFFKLRDLHKALLYVRLEDVDPLPLRALFDPYAAELPAFFERSVRAFLRAEPLAPGHARRLVRDLLDVRVTAARLAPELPPDPVALASARLHAVFAFADALVSLFSNFSHSSLPLFVQKNLQIHSSKKSSNGLELSKSSSNREFVRNEFVGGKTSLKNSGVLPAMDELNWEQALEEAIQPARCAWTQLLCETQAAEEELRAEGDEELARPLAAAREDAVGAVGELVDAYQRAVLEAGRPWPFGASASRARSAVRAALDALDADSAALLSARLWRGAQAELGRLALHAPAASSLNDALQNLTAWAGVLGADARLEPPDGVRALMRLRAQDRATLVEVHRRRAAAECQGEDAQGYAVSSAALLELLAQRTDDSEALRYVREQRAAMRSLALWRELGLPCAPDAPPTEAVPCGEGTLWLSASHGALDAAEAAARWGVAWAEVRRIKKKRVAGGLRDNAVRISAAEDRWLTGLRARNALFDRLAELLRRAVGPDRVHVYPRELLVDPPAEAWGTSSAPSRRSASSKDRLKEKDKDKETSEKILPPLEKEKEKEKEKLPPLSREEKKVERLRKRNEKMSKYFGPELENPRFVEKCHAALVRGSGTRTGGKLYVLETALGFRGTVNTADTLLLPFDNILSISKSKSGLVIPDAIRFVPIKGQEVTFCGLFSRDDLFRTISELWKACHKSHVIVRTDKNSLTLNIGRGK